MGNNFSDNLKRYREKIPDLTQEKLADELKISRSAIGNYELGIRTPKIEDLKALAKYFNVSINELYGISCFNDEQIEEIREYAFSYLQAIDDVAAREIGDYGIVALCESIAYHNVEPTFEDILRIAEVTHCSIDEVLGRAHNKKPATGEGDGLSETKQRLIEFILTLDDSDVEKIHALADIALKG